MATPSLFSQVHNSMSSRAEVVRIRAACDSTRTYLGAVEARRTSGGPRRRVSAQHPLGGRGRETDPGIAFAATLDAGGAAHDMVQASIWDRRLRAGIRGVRSVVQQAAWPARELGDGTRVYLSLPDPKLIEAYPGFEPIDPAELPAEATLLIGHQDAFAERFRFPKRD
jgi:hypothetical protein